MRVTSAVSVGAQCAPNLRAEPLDGYGVLKYGDEVGGGKILHVTMSLWDVGIPFKNPNSSPLA